MLDWLLFSMRELLLAMICVFVTVQIATLCTTVYLHRALSHRAVALARPVEIAMRALIWLTTGIEPRQWAAVHRKHHKFADAEGDPHSPYVHGFWQIQLLNYFYYRREAANPETIARFTRDMVDDGWDRLFSRTWLGLLLFAGILVVVFGPLLGAIAFAAHVLWYIFLNSSINGAAHWIGYQRFPNSARNMWLLALLTSGEGLHNNHHEFPGSSRFAQRWWEIDPGWYTIALLRSCGLAEPAPSVAIGD
jgi:stearoyl-CoA desaturase (delta-9 desaturase)